MGLSTDIVVRACERVFVRVCDLGQSVPAGTPAAAFLSGAARQVDEAQRELAQATTPEGLGAALRLLGRAGGLLGEVDRMTEQEVEGLERVSVIVEGLCVTIEMDQRAEARAEDTDPLR